MIRVWPPAAAESHVPCPPKPARSDYRRKADVVDSSRALRRAAGVADLSCSDGELAQEQLSQTAIPLLR